MAEKVVVQLVLDTSRYTKGASNAARETAKIQSAADKTSKSVSGLGSTALKAGAALAVAFAAKAALNFAKSSIAAFSNLDESINAIEVSYGDAAEGVLALGENSATQFGLSARAVNEAAVAMSAFASKIDAADPPGAFKNVLQRATDFASVMNIEVEESLLLFRSGLAGESEPLRKFGIDVSAATVNLVGLEAGLGGSNGKLSEGEKVQARYLAIMQQTTKVVGDFANTSDGLANSQRILSAEWETAQVAIGEVLVPAMTDFVQLLTEAATAVPDFVTRLDRGFAKLVRGFKIFNASWTEADEAIFNVTKRIGDYEVSLAGGISESQAFQGVLLGLSDAGESHVATLRALVNQTDISEQSLRDALGVLIRNKEEYGLTGEQVAQFQGLLQELLFVELGVAQATGDVTGALGETGLAAENAISPTARYNQVVKTSKALAAGAAAAEERRAAGIRSVLAAQAEAASPALRLLRAQQGLVRAQERLEEVRTGRGEDKATEAETGEAILSLLDAQAGLDAATANISGRVGGSVAAVEELGTTAGATREEMELLLELFGLFPTSIDVDFNIRGPQSIGEVLQILRGTTPIPRFADPKDRRHGGPVAADEPFIVGEGGPELFIPDQAGRIIPNNSIGGQSIVVNVNDSTTTDLAADLSAGLIAAQITQQVEMLRI